jgi:glycosyltransferase involved in cell wall biosynthesis
LVVGNGGIVSRHSRFWAQRSDAVFLTEVASQVRQACFCAWLDPADDPLAAIPIDSIRSLRTRALPRFVGSLWERNRNGILALMGLIGEILRADFVYLYWPGKLSVVAAGVCRALGKSYGIYFRGEQIPSESSFDVSFSRARFVLSTGEALARIARVHCRDVSCVTPMIGVGLADLREPMFARREGAIRLLFVGRVEERKGAFDLLRALSYLDEWSVPYELTVVGHCSAPERFRAMIAPQAADRVRSIGGVSDPAELARQFKNADVLVVPSYEEGFPRVLYEGMAFGIPIITTFVGSIESEMVDRENCLRIEVGNPRDIAIKVRALAEDANLAFVISRAASHHVRKRMLLWTKSHAHQVLDILKSSERRGIE